MENKDALSSYISLANKYRPQRFEDMVGQESISKTLQNAIKSGRIAHAYLFYGPRGCGKTTTARILAKALNCTGHGEDKPSAEPCGQCPQCLEIAQSADIDVLELDAASNTQVEKVREAIIDTVALAATRDRFKVFILDEVHMLSDSSFNALLKTIEEPPAHVIFILATTEKHKVPATIVSRCQTFRFRPLTLEEITAHLLDLSGAENIDLTPTAAKVIAKNAGGAMRDALTLLDRAIAFCGAHIDEKSVSDMLGLTPEELIKQALSALIKKDNAALHQVFQTLQTEGFDANSFLKDLKNVLGEAFYFVLGQGEEPFEEANQILTGVNPGFLAQLSRKINKICEEVKFSDNPFISAEVGLFTVMDSCLDIENLVRRLEALERGETLPPSASSASGPVGTDKPIVRSATRPRPQKTSFAETAPVAKSAATAKTVQPVQTVTPEPQTASLQTEISNQKLWEKMLRHFEKSPFVYDVMLNCSVAFNQNEWTLSFAPEKAFYQIPAQSKLSELEKAALELSSRQVKIRLVTDTPSVAAPVNAAKKVAPRAEILDEEPLSVPPSLGVPASGENAPEEVKEILDIYGGELLPNV